MSGPSGLLGAIYSVVAIVIRPRESSRKNGGRLETPEAGGSKKAARRSPGAFRYYHEQEFKIATASRAGDGIQSTHDCYRATTFRVERPNGHIDIRIGEKTPRIDALLVDHKASEWAYITAWNPGSQTVSAEINASAHARLMDLVGKRPFSEGDGIPDNPAWQAERSIWFAGVGRRQAMDIGARFGQNAIVVGALGGVAELVLCSD